MTVSVPTVECTCGGGDAKTLEVLRATSLADLDATDFNELVAAVNKAGGVTATVGLPRVLITKAIERFNDGVAKGDYVGHPFRGNQYADASGASRGGAGGPRNYRRPLNASEQILGAMNDRITGRDTEARDEADAFVRSMLGSQADETAEVIERQHAGVGNLKDGAETAARNADRQIEQAENYDNPEEAERQRGIKKVHELVAKFADTTMRVLLKAQGLVERAKKGIDIAADTNAARQNAEPRVRMARMTLLRLDRELKDRAETERSMGRSGYGPAHTQASATLTMLRGAIRASLDALGDLQTELETSPDAALEVEREILDSRE